MLIPIMTLQQKNDPGKSENDKISYGLKGMTVLGFGEVFSGLVHGYIIDRIGSKNTAWINTVIVIGMTVVILLSIWRN